MTSSYIPRSLPTAAICWGAAFLLAGVAGAEAQQGQRRGAAASQTAAAPAPSSTQAAPEQAKASAQPVDAAATGQAGSGSFAVKGFRSAQFGMNEVDLKAAIVRDFKVKPEAIRTDENKLERTRVMLVQGAEVLPGGGKAELAYVLGYESKTLIQVSITWSKAVDDKMTPEQLFNNANILRSHFITQGYKPDSIATNIAVNGGLMMFRGNDEAGRSTLLMLQGTIAQSEPNSAQRVLTPTALSLFYIADARKPDIYRLPQGSF